MAAKIIMINGDAIAVSLSESHFEILVLLAANKNRLVKYQEIQNIFSRHMRKHYRRNDYDQCTYDGRWNPYGWNLRVHMAAIRKQVKMHGFDILAEKNQGYKLITNETNEAMQ